MNAYNATDTDRLLGVAFAVLRYLEAREATAEAKFMRHAEMWIEGYHSAPTDTDAANRAVLSAAARQSAAMRWLKRCAKQLEDTA